MVVLRAEGAMRRWLQANNMQTAPSNLPNTPSGVISLSRSLLAWVVLALGLFITWLGWQAASTVLQQQRQDYFDFRVREAVTQIAQRMQVQTQILRGAQGLFNATASVERRQFRSYIAGLNLAQDYPGILVVGYSLLVESADKDAHLASMKKQGFPNYSIQPEGLRNRYTPLIFIEPFSERNLRAFGYDTYSDSVRRKAIDAACDNDDVALSSKIRLVQEMGENEQAGVLMYLPVYRTGAPHSTLAQRRVNIIGWVNSAFRMDDLMRGIFGEHADDLDIEIFDGTQANQANQMYDSVTASGMQHPAASLFNTRQTIDFAQHFWTISINSTPDLQGRVNGMLPI